MIFAGWNQCFELMSVDFVGWVTQRLSVVCKPGPTQSGVSLLKEGWSSNSQSGNSNGSVATAVLAM